jgi:branched-chain amino acid transport system permease protein
VSAYFSTLLSGQLLFSALVAGSLYALVALGLNLVYGTMRLLNVAHGDFVMLGAYAAYWAFVGIGWSPAWAAILVPLACALAGVALYETFFRQLIASHGSIARLEANSLLLFFGLSVIIQNTVALTFTATPRGYQFLDEVYRVGDIAMTGNRLATLIIAGGICAAVAFFLRFNVFGLALQAIIENPNAARVIGVNVGLVHRVSFAAGFASAGVAGVLVSAMEQFSPFIGFPITISAFIVVILGGLGNIFGGIVAAFLLGALETYGVAMTSANLRSVLLYGVFVATILVFPQGLIGRRVVR